MRSGAEAEGTFRPARRTYSGVDRCAWNTTQNK